MPHSQDSLHLLNNIMTAVEHLKVDLKPEPKSNIERYGYIYAAGLGAFIAIVGSIVTFCLTARKERKVTRIETRSKLYGELMGSRSNLIEMLRRKEISSIMNYYFIGLAKVSLIENVQSDNRKLSFEMMDNIKEYSLEFNKEIKEFESRIGQYIYLKGGKSKIKNLLDEFIQDTRKITYESRFKELTTEEGFEQMKETVYKEFNNEVYYEIIVSKSLAVIDCILKDE